MIYVGFARSISGEVPDFPFHFVQAAAEFKSARNNSEVHKTRLNDGTSTVHGCIHESGTGRRFGAC